MLQLDRDASAEFMECSYDLSDSFGEVVAHLDPVDARAYHQGLVLFLAIWPQVGCPSRSANLIVHGARFEVPRTRRG